MSINTNTKKTKSSVHNTAQCASLKSPFPVKLLSSRFSKCFTSRENSCRRGLCFQPSYDRVKTTSKAFCRFAGWCRLSLIGERNNLPRGIFVAFAGWVHLTLTDELPGSCVVCISELRVNKPLYLHYSTNAHCALFYFLFFFPFFYLMTHASFIVLQIR